MHIIYLQTCWWKATGDDMVRERGKQTSSGFSVGIPGNVHDLLVGDREEDLSQESFSDAHL